MKSVEHLDKKLSKSSHRLNRIKMQFENFLDMNFKYITFILSLHGFNHDSPHGFYNQDIVDRAVFSPRRIYLIVLCFLILPRDYRLGLHFHSSLVVTLATKCSE